MQLDQTVFNVLITVAGALGGWVLNTLWTAVKDLQKDDKELASRVSEIEVLIVGKYLTRDEFNTAVGSINQKLDTIVDRVNNKADR